MSFFMMQYHSSQVSLQRLNLLTSVDEFMNIPEPRPSAYQAAVKDADDEDEGYEADESTGQTEQYSALDLDLAFATPESYTVQLHQRRACEPPRSSSMSPYDHDGLRRRFGNEGVPYLQYPRALSSRLSSLGRRARDSVADLTLKRNPPLQPRSWTRPNYETQEYSIVPTATSSVGNLDDLSDSACKEHSMAPQATSSVGNMDDVSDSVSEGQSIAAQATSSVGDLYEVRSLFEEESIMAQASSSVGDLDDTVDSLRPSLSSSRDGPLYESDLESSMFSNAEVEYNDDHTPRHVGEGLYTSRKTGRLAAKISKVVHKAFDNGDFDERARRHRFRYALGNNVTEETHWAASALHARQVVRRSFDMNQRFRYGLRFGSYPEDGKEEPDVDTDTSAVWTGSSTSETDA